MSWVVSGQHLRRWQRLPAVEPLSTYQQWHWSSQCHTEASHHNDTPVLCHAPCHSVMPMRRATVPCQCATPQCHANATRHSAMQMRQATVPCLSATPQCHANAARQCHANAPRQSCQCATPQSCQCATPQCHANALRYSAMPKRLVSDQWQGLASGANRKLLATFLEETWCDEADCMGS